VVIDTATGAVVAGTRLGFGKEIVEGRGWSALYTARWWAFDDGMVRVTRHGWR
jgi:hypothetical protein